MLPLQNTVVLNSNYSTFLFLCNIIIFDNMGSLSRKNALILLLAVSILTIIPFLGLINYNTKGEPRESIVAYSMLKTNNWVLPQNNGGDIAYKPPFFHWSIAVISKAVGVLNEFTSRTPSAIAVISMVIIGFLFFSKRKDVQTAILGAFITLTAFEVHRAGCNCRVDMVLTVCIVGALYALYIWNEKGAKRIPIAAILLMSIGTLTKGPVAIILPSLVMGTFMLIRRKNFWHVLFSYTAIAVASLIIPFLWYYAAYRQGGNNFLSLVMEENIGRFTGKMSYESHVNSWPYNIITIIAGFVPWTLLLVYSLFILPYSKIKGYLKRIIAKNQNLKSNFILSLWKRIKHLDDVDLFTLLSIALIFIFYCIPKSKRSVYLLPIYPFMAFFISQYITYLIKKHLKVIKAYGYTLSIIAIILTATFIALQFNLISTSIFHGKHAAENIAYMQALQHPSLFTWIVVLLPIIATVIWIKYKNINAVVFMTFALFLALDAGYEPLVLNTKSDKNTAIEIRKIIPTGSIDSYIKQEQTADMLHFFTTNFYCDNRVRMFNDKTATSGYLIIGNKDEAEFINNHKQTFEFKLRYKSTKRSCDTGQIIELFSYRHK